VAAPSVGFVECHPGHIVSLHGTLLSIAGSSNDSDLSSYAVDASCNALEPPVGGCLLTQTLPAVRIVDICLVINRAYCLDYEQSAFCFVC